MRGISAGVQLHPSWRWSTARATAFHREAHRGSRHRMASQSADVAPALALDLRVSDIWPSVLSQYDQAQASGAATQTETTTEVILDPTTGLPWVIRLAAALKAKPAPLAHASTQGQGPAGKKPPWRNPFLPPEPELTVGHLSPTHTLVLNKFNVVAHHCLVVTRTFQSQSDPLNADDLEATWKLLKAMPSGGLAFYNSGPHSGRSQPHKHLQVVPLPLAAGLPAQPLIQPALLAATTAAAAGPLQPIPVRQLPWQCVAAQLPADASPQQLAAAYDALLQHSQLVAGYQAAPAGSQLGGTGNQVAEGATQQVTGQDQAVQAFEKGVFSYNVLLTTEWMVVVPRSQECDGPLAVNALGFAGTLLVRDEQGADHIRTHGPSKVLTTVGLPWT